MRNARRGWARRWPRMSCGWRHGGGGAWDPRQNHNHSRNAICEGEKSFVRCLPVCIRLGVRKFQGPQSSKSFGGHLNFSCCAMLRVASILRRRGRSSHSACRRGPGTEAPSRGFLNNPGGSASERLQAHRTQRKPLRLTGGGFLVAESVVGIPTYWMGSPRSQARPGSGDELPAQHTELRGPEVGRHQLVAGHGPPVRPIKAPYLGQRWRTRRVPQTSKFIHQ